jgi:2-keto-4-pentenoate hydratase/2-oxohepta-3-ene-1,7-dioic acid hydratase in catechol pathway
VRVLSFSGTDGVHLGVVAEPAGRRVGDVTVADVTVVDVTAAEPGLPRDLAVVLAAGDLDRIRAAAEQPGAPRRPLAELTLLGPVPRPPKFLAIGLNYADHRAESKTLVTGQPGQHQLWFNKQSTCVIGAGQPIHIPRASDIVDYEGELGFVIGRRCRHVPADRARDVIAGYTVVNDVSVRDWQRNSPTMTMGKSFDTHGPAGPWLVTADEVPDPHRLRLRTWVSGDLRQDASTSDMIFSCWQMVEHLSTAFTLEPGDLISTGTPAGVGIARDPPALLRPGDTVRIEVEGVGVLENPVIAEPAGTALLPGPVTRVAS